MVSYQRLELKYCNSTVAVYGDHPFFFDATSESISWRREDVGQRVLAAEVDLWAMKRVQLFNTIC